MKRKRMTTEHFRALLQQESLKRVLKLAWDVTQNRDALLEDTLNRLETALKDYESIAE